MTSLKVQWDIGKDLFNDFFMYKHICAYSRINTKNLHALIFLVKRVQRITVFKVYECHPLGSYSVPVCIKGNILPTGVCLMRSKVTAGHLHTGIADRFPQASEYHTSIFGCFNF